MTVIKQSSTVLITGSKRHRELWRMVRGNSQGRSAARLYLQYWPGLFVVFTVIVNGNFLYSPHPFIHFSSFFRSSLLFLLVGRDWLLACQSTSSTPVWYITRSVTYYLIPIAALLSVTRSKSPWWFASSLFLLLFNTPSVELRSSPFWTPIRKLRDEFRSTLAIWGYFSTSLRLRKLTRHRLSRLSTEG